MENELFALNETGTASRGRLDGQRSRPDVAAAFESEFEGAEDGARERDVLGVGEEVIGDGDRRLHATRTTAGDGAATA